MLATGPNNQRDERSILSWSAGDRLAALRTRLYQPEGQRWLRIPSTPLGLFALVLVLIFLVESTLMLILPKFPLLQRFPMLMVVLDAGLLVATLCPALWLLMIRPIRHLAQERGQLLRQQLSIQESERAHLARELHDELGQVQTAILLTTRAARQVQSVDELKEHLVTIHGLASSAVESTRRLAKGLSPGVLADFGLTTALDRLMEDCNVVNGPLITLESSLKDARFCPDVELVAYRVIQEAVLNALKHSGGTKIEASVRYDGKNLHLMVQDNGIGIGKVSSRSTASTGLGLRGMRERLEVVRGTLSIRVNPDGGTCVQVQIPAEART